MDLKLVIDIVILGLKLFFPTVDTKILEQVLGAQTEVIVFQEYQVTEVIDGDTFKIWLNGTEQTVRLLGIDTPETKHPQKGVECYGREASSKLSELIEGKIVTLIPDTKQPNIDRYDRLLRYVYINENIDVNQIMVSEGYAKTYTSLPSDKMEYYLTLETEAKAKNLGLWSQCQNQFTK